MKKRAIHLAIWIDQKQARIVQVRGDRMEAAAFGKDDGEDVHRKHRALSDASRERRDTKRFFARVADSIQVFEAEQILLLGPSTAKLDFARYLRKHAHVVERKIVGIETMAQPTDDQLHAFTQEYFPRSACTRFG
jgi:stalled ribosome rescue protein Dom34